MRIERSITTVSWIPSDLLEGMGKMATRMKLAHHDPPPPDTLGGDVVDALNTLRGEDRFRFANHLRAYIEVGESGKVTAAGYTGAGMIGATTVGLGVGSITIPAVKLPDLVADPEQLADGSVRFSQTVGGRTGAPMPRAVKRPPFVQYHAPTVWTTLQLTIGPDGSHSATMTGASGFPRHWVYDDAGRLVAKTSVAEYKRWMNASFGHRTPWGDEDSPALVSQIESLLERELHDTIMRGSHKPRVRTVKQGHPLFEQDDPDDGELYMLLNGLLLVEVGGQPEAEIGPGAVFGERASLDGGGRRTATLRAVTDCKIAAAPLAGVDFDRLDRLAEGHRREREHPGSAATNATSGLHT